MPSHTHRKTLPGLAIGLALISLVAGCRTSLLAAPQESPTSPVIADRRICAALEVYRLADADDYGLRAVIAQTTFNSFAAAGQVADCGAGVAATLRSNFSPRRWQDALDAVDAVSSGSYLVPDACARASAMFPLSPAAASIPLLADPPSAVRAQCVISNLVFVELPA